MLKRKGFWSRLAAVLPLNLAHKPESEAFFYKKKFKNLFKQDFHDNLKIFRSVRSATRIYGVESP